MNTNRKIGIVGITSALAVSAATALAAAGAHNNERTDEHMGGMMGGSGMMGMMRGKGSMMSSCPMMQRSQMPDARSQRPNEQWREKPAATREKGG